MLDFATTAFLSVLFLVDPPGAVPAFIALTGRQPPARRRRTALVACLAATAILMGFAAVGSVLFRVLGLTLPAFQIAGGLILYRAALDMVRGSDGPAPLEDRDDVAITPLAIPLLAGPAALSTVTVLMGKAQDTAEASLVFAAIGLTGLVSYLTLRLAEPIQRRMGKTGIDVVGRVLGLVLAGIAVQFVIEGLKAAGLLPAGAVK